MMNELNDLNELKVWIALILNELEKLYHNEARAPELGHDEPLDGLILTVLSQNTNDKNRDAAFKRLKERFPVWAELADRNIRELEDTIRPAGLAPTKSRRILDILDIINQDFGEYSIKELANRDRSEIRKYLTSLPGVGAKTAACVMMFDLKIPAFPVDTHISRIARRTGLAAANMTAENISLMLESNVEPERYLGGHVNMIEHGRALCCARNAKCDMCPLSKLDLCKFKNKNYY